MTDLRTTLAAAIAAAILPVAAHAQASFEQALAACAMAVEAPADAEAALIDGGFAKGDAADDGATVLTAGTMTVTIGPDAGSCVASDSAMGTEALREMMLGMVGTEMPETTDAAGCRQFDMGSGVAMTVTGADDATVCDAEAGAAVRFAKTM